jgi:hypothetical protein
VLTVSAAAPDAPCAAGSAATRIHMLLLQLLLLSAPTSPVLVAVSSAYID